MPMNRKHIEVVAAVIKYKNLYLLVQRPFKGEVGGKWEFPGGKIEPGETHSDALLREIKEELNMSISVSNHILTKLHSYNTFNLKIHFYECNVSNNELQLKEHLNFVWVEKTQINFYELASADVEVVALL
jgi:8-oxo-dGTP diphosphatase